MAGTYVIKNRHGKVLRNREGQPFVYTAEWTARVGAKVLRTRQSKGDRPLRVVPA